MFPIDQPVNFPRQTVFCLFLFCCQTWTSVLLMPILAVSMLNAKIPWVHTDVYAKSGSMEMDTPAMVRHN